MENRPLNLPIGIQTFEKLRNGGNVYVDKTKYLVNLIDKGTIYFLARPRRFGKSLTVSTFDALFSGNKELFKGLYAEEFMNRPDYLTHPVIRLDMSNVTTDKGIEGMDESLLQLTQEAADSLEVELSDSKLAGILLNELIVKAAKKYNQKVVMLLDEYDKPYTDFMMDNAMAEKVRHVLRSYYSCIKTKDEYIRFTFITGISKFARFGVFSTLNSPNDISLNPDYANICGYTEDEILHYFPDYIEATARSMNLSCDELIEKMRYYYNGFTFDYDTKSRLYNPFSTLSFFDKKQFLNYWINTGKPKFIADYMKDRKLTVEEFRHLPVSVDFAENPGDVDDTPPEGFFYQSGYLTLRPGTIMELSLDYPNREALNSMSALMSQNLLQRKDESFNGCQSDLLNGLMTKNHEKVIASFNRLLTCVPYDDHTLAARQSISNNHYEMQPQEWLYRSTILGFLHGCGVVVVAEMHTNKGRADLVVAWRGIIWVIELKVAFKGQNAEEKAETALQQIIDNNYAKPFITSGLSSPNVVCLAVVIDDTMRQITASRSLNFKPETINHKL